MPYVVLKSAMTLDGKIACKTGDSKWISGEESRQYVHELRNEFKAIMVGINTVLEDNPQLTSRIENRKARNPIIIVLDTNLRIPIDAKLVQNDSETIIVCKNEADSIKIKELQALGCTVLEMELNNKGRISLTKLMKELALRKIDGILLEGGAELSYSAIEEAIVDELNLFIAPKIVGGRNAKSFLGGEGVSKVKDAWNLKDMSTQVIGEDILIRAWF
jgi:diaminohydroxyphosphoribosylaminopyrimidine deaminase/5-amino-6-(5-phosphoribosylamino)uracil reductase